MKVIQINSYYSGSTGKIANQINKEVIRRGDKGLFIYGFGPNSVPNGYKCSNKINFIIHTISSMLIGLHGYFSLLPTIRVLRQVSKYKPDIVHVHNLHGGYINFLLLLYFLGHNDIQLVLTIHDCWIYTGKCYHYYEAQCNKYLNSCGKCPQLKMYPKSYFFDFTARMLIDKKKIFGCINKATVVCISEWLKKEVENSMLGKFPICVIPNGVSEKFAYLDIKKSSNKFVILGVAASWSIHKGIMDFVKLATMLDENYELVLVGNSCPEIQLPHSIRTIEHTENIEELAELYNTADVYVSLSTEETFGLSIAEALACGVPSIVYNSTACPEMIVNGINGYIVEPHDVACVFARIKEIKEKNIFNRKAISKDAIGKYAIQNMSDQYYILYNDLIK